MQKNTRMLRSFEKNACPTLQVYHCSHEDPTKFLPSERKKKLIKQKQLVAVFLTLLSQRDSLSRLGITIDDASGQIRGCCFIYKKIVPCFPTFILKKQEVAVHFINSLNYMQSEFPEILRSCRTTY